jgi:hypothetical protein
MRLIRGPFWFLLPIIVGLVVEFDIGSARRGACAGPGGRQRRLAPRVEGRRHRGDPSGAPVIPKRSGPAGTRAAMSLPAWGITLGNL